MADISDLFDMPLDVQIGEVAREKGITKENVRERTSRLRISMKRHIIEIVEETYEPPTREDIERETTGRTRNDIAYSQLVQIAEFFERRPFDIYDQEGLFTGGDSMYQYKRTSDALFGKYLLRHVTRIKERNKKAGRRMGNRATILSQTLGVKTMAAKGISDNIIRLGKTPTLYKTEYYLRKLGAHIVLLPEASPYDPVYEIDKRYRNAALHEDSEEMLDVLLAEINLFRMIGQHHQDNEKVGKLNEKLEYWQKTLKARLKIVKEIPQYDGNASSLQDVLKGTPLYEILCKYKEDSCR